MASAPADPKHGNQIHSRASGESAQSSLSEIRKQIRSRRLSFPSQVPVFTRLHRPDIQWRMVVLYFVRGWSSTRIAERYGITRERVRQILRQWVSRAQLHGYVDLVPSETEYASLSFLFVPAAS